MLYAMADKLVRAKKFNGILYKVSRPVRGGPVWLAPKLNNNGYFVKFILLAKWPRRGDFFLLKKN